MNIICFSHLRWNEGSKRPQEFMRLSAESYDVYYVEQAVVNNDEDGYRVFVSDRGVKVITPHLKYGIGHEDLRLNNLLFELFEEYKLRDYIFWFYSPLAIGYTHDFTPSFTIYDCMEESSLLKFNSIFLECERRLLDAADLVITGGKRQYEYKRNFHNNVHCVPGSIDKTHFSQARKDLEQPSDQAHIPHPRLGFFGVIDERLDIELITAGADARPDWHFVLVGPVMKIDHEHLPVRDNIHYLGDKSYDELPSYLSGWDITLIPFVINESTRFIHPSKTSEYLAAGKPVIATRIADVIDPYGDKGLVHIIYNASELIDVAEIELARNNKEKWLQKVDAHLGDSSWEDAWSKIHMVMEEAIDLKKYEEKVGQKICV